MNTIMPPIEPELALEFYRKNGRYPNL